ncbi:MAG: Rpn family recombination-promoting nuclease/putative transposase [Hespellia sp.]|nr:Rpn family recombination-promoting nuclease/putative transposase [Hespellia sp.]
MNNTNDNFKNIIETNILPEDYQFNLSDFALFLSVMKNRKAYECTLSIILDELDIKLAEVKVEQVILNKSGKRAIRLDAWAVSTDHRQFNMEMENHSKKDYLPKRSRFYQGMLDSPILKSGKKTKYKHLPSTVIIFITQDDLFGKDLAKYTFTEQCEEVKDLYLEDGTKKIFLNMTSKNGSKDLISLLQYMKETDIDNPEIIVKDERIVELDQIVREVKESEEWEAVKMNILEVGVKRGLEQGLEQGEELFARLTERLISDDRVADLTQAAKDKKFRNKLYQEYGFVKMEKK